MAARRRRIHRPRVTSGANRHTVLSAFLNELKHQFLFSIWNLNPSTPSVSNNNNAIETIALLTLTTNR